MKKIMLSIVIVMCLVLTACGASQSDNSRTSEKVEEAPDRAYNDNMSLNEYITITNTAVEFATDIGDVFSQLASLSEKYADIINSSDTFDWSQYWDFREIKEDAITACDKILAYDDSICSKEYQMCIDECKSMAYQIKSFFNTISTEMDVNEIDTLFQNIANNITIGSNNATIYQTMATITYMEANDGDPEIIKSLRSQVEENYIYKVTISESDSLSGSDKSSAKSIIFTNSYGTSTTKCAHSGCTNPIATSGDTNCCITHSNKCFNCGKYIDEDAMFCMDCLSGKTTSLTDTGKYSSSTKLSKGGCQYTYFDGSVCGKSTNKYASLCDSHFKQLNDTYQSFVGK